MMRWPLAKQIQRGDLHALGETVASSRTEKLHPRTRMRSVWCRRYVPTAPSDAASGCTCRTSVSPILKAMRIRRSQPLLCPKGSATFQLVTGSIAFSTFCIAGRMPESGSRFRSKTPWRWSRSGSRRLVNANWDAENHRTMAIAHLGGATLDNEENYLIKKLFTALGILQIENQARI